MKPTLMILAAGLGSRYQGLKQIDPVGPHGEYLLDYAVFDAIRAGFGKVVFLITPEIDEAFKATISPRYEKQIELGYAYQTLDALPEGYQTPKNRSKPWGTGHAILCAKRVITTPFAVINADDFYGLQSFKMMATALKTMAPTAKEWCMMGFHLKNTLSNHGKVSRGVCQAKDNYLGSVVEHEKIERMGDHICYLDANNTLHSLLGESIVSMNFWGFAPQSFFPLLEASFIDFLKEHQASGELPLKTEFYIPSAVDHAIQQHQVRVKVLETSESWFGLTFPEDKSKVQQKILEKIKAQHYPACLFK